MEENERLPLHGSGIQNNYYGTVQQVVIVQSQSHKHRKNFRFKQADVGIYSPGNQIVQQQHNNRKDHGRE